VWEVTETPLKARDAGVYALVEGTRQAGRRAGGRPSEAGECAHSEPPDIIRHRRWRSVAIGGVLATDAKASYGKKVGLSAKLRSVLTVNAKIP
jgi:hypothetical protein